MITWSSKSRRQLPTQRSATPFCHGLRKAVRIGWLPKSSQPQAVSARNAIAADIIIGDRSLTEDGLAGRYEGRVPVWLNWNQVVPVVTVNPAFRVIVEVKPKFHEV